jgi:hypothetical protein
LSHRACQKHVDAKIGDRLPAWPHMRT